MRDGGRDRQWVRVARSSCLRMDGMASRVRRSGEGGLKSGGRDVEESRSDGRECLGPDITSRMGVSPFCEREEKSNW
jgi:hypothetical protein